MTEPHPFKWGHFQAEIILLCVHWYAAPIRSAIVSLQEMMLERGLQVDHTTIYRLSCNATPQSWNGVVDHI